MRNPIVLVLVSLGLLVGCSGEASFSSRPADTPPASSEPMPSVMVMSQGNFSWLPIEKEGRPDPRDVIATLDTWERLNPELEIMSFELYWGPEDIYRYQRGWSGAYTHGIFVTHRARTR